MTDLEDHYAAIHERHGFHPVEFDLGPLPASYLRRCVAAVSDPESVERATERATKVCTGVGMTGPPHLGTLAQFHLACDLQRAGLDVQFVLADLEPYHHGAPLGEVRALAARYRSLAHDLGFDPDSGVLRTQSEGTGAMRTAALLAPHHPVPAGDGDHEATDWERAVEESYSGHERPGPTSEAASTLSGLLHLADFLHPLFAQGYDQVVVALGADECGLTTWARRAVEAFPVEGRIDGLHCRMVPAADGPKMSKSIGSGVHLGLAPDEVRAGVRNLATAKPDGVYRAMCVASDWDEAELAGVEKAKEDGGEAWDAAVERYADEVATLARRW